MIAILALIVYATLITGLLFGVIASSSKDMDSLTRKLDEQTREARAYRDLYQNAVYQLGGKENSQVSQEVHHAENRV